MVKSEHFNQRERRKNVVVIEITFHCQPHARNNLNTFNKQLKDNDHNYDYFL